MTPTLTRTPTFDTFTNANAIKQGMVKYKEGGITSMLWKTKYAVLRQNTLEFQKAEGAKISFAIILAHVTGLTRYEAIPNCFELVRAANPAQFPGTPLREQPQKCLYMKFDRDEDLYEWQDSIYNRCPSISGVSAPTNFSHKVHVGFDPGTGAFLGLPQEWERLLNNSAITKDDYRKNPQAVIEVLEFYSEQQKRGGEQQYGAPGSNPAMPGGTPMGIGHSSSNAGASIAPPRPGPPGSFSSASSQPYGMTPPRSQAQTPSGSRSVSGASTQQPNGAPQDDKLNMGSEMRRLMEEEKRKIQQQQEARDRQRRLEAEARERDRREFDEYQASIPKKAGTIAQQEVGGGGYSNGQDRYTPGRAAPAAPGDRSRQQTQQRQQPRQVGGTNDPPRAPYAQSSSSSRDQSPTPGRMEQLQPPSHPAERTQSPSTRPPNGIAAAPRAPPGSQPKPLNVNKTNATNAQRKPDASKQEAEAKPAEKKKEARMSSMSEAEVMSRLRKIVTRYDPNETYSKQKKIGQGASGSVYIAKVRSDATSPVGKSLYRRDGSDARVAIKTMDLRHQPRKELIVNEIIVMKESVHPNIVNYLDSFLIEGDSELWVIMEYMNGGALTDVIENNPVISEDQISAICNEVCDRQLKEERTNHVTDMQRSSPSTHPGNHSPRHQI